MRGGAIGRVWTAAEPPVQYPGRRGRTVLVIVVIVVLGPLLGGRPQLSFAALADHYCGPLTANATWTAADGPYYLDCRVYVQQGVTLTIEPGTTVYVAKGAELWIGGTIVAVGTASQPITFTWVKPSTDNYSWFGIVFDTNASLSSDIAFASIDHARSPLFQQKFPVQDMHFSWDGSGVSSNYVRDSTFQNIEGAAIVALGSAVINGVSIFDSYYGVESTGGPSKSTNVSVSQALFYRDHTVISDDAVPLQVTDSTLVYNHVVFSLTLPEDTSNWLIESNNVYDSDLADLQLKWQTKTPSPLLIGSNYWETTDLNQVESGLPICTGVAETCATIASPLSSPVESAPDVPPDAYAPIEFSVVLLEVTDGGPALANVAKDQQVQLLTEVDVPWVWGTVPASVTVHIVLSKRSVKQTSKTVTLTARSRSQQFFSFVYVPTAGGRYTVTSTFFAGGRHERKTATFTVLS